MYRIKAKPGYNVILKDIEVNLKSENEKWIEVPKELLDNSKDARTLSAFYIKEDISANKVVVAEEKVEKVEVKKEEAFVAHKTEEKQPEGVFIAAPKGQEVEQIVEVKAEAKVLEDTEVVEVSATAEIKIDAEEVKLNAEEIKVEAKEVKVETKTTQEAKAEKTKTATKSAPKATTKKSPNKK